MFPDLGGKLILASESPRRAELLKLVGARFEVRFPGVDEDKHENAPPALRVEELARRKALAVACEVDDGFVVGADTTVVLDGRILGKPSSVVQAKEMLRALSGRWHDVYTGIALVDVVEHRIVASSEKTRVKIRPLTQAEIDRYVASGEPMDKAGSYGIQGLGAVFIERVDGCYFNVMGLPLSLLYTLALRIKECGNNAADCADEVRPGDREKRKG